MIFYSPADPPASLLTALHRKPLDKYQYLDPTACAIGEYLTGGYLIIAAVDAIQPG
jgi:hypothetical protein